MTFTATVFGTYVVGTGFTDGDAVTDWDFIPYIHVQTLIGAADIEVTITYVDQDGNTAEAATTTTTIPAASTIGTMIPIILNTGDTGIQDITDITITGGTAADEFTVENYNENVCILYEPTMLLPPTEQIGVLKLTGVNSTLKVLWPWKNISVDSVNADVLRLTGTDINLKTWQKSVLLIQSYEGIVMSGYVVDQTGAVILNAKTIMFECSADPTKNVMGRVNPDTGLYQVKIREYVYDKRYLMVDTEDSDVAMTLKEFGSTFVDGVNRDLPNQNFAFWNSHVHAKSIAHVDSLVTY
jgi:hypothetical protein